MPKSAPMPLMRIPIKKGTLQGAFLLVTTGCGAQLASC
jgi:hypothetical protein